jgi:hypothetical protein
MEPRFKVVSGSQSCHCCFKYTVVDSTKPDMIGDEQYKDHFESVCECFEEADARKVCDALNGQESQVHVYETSKCLPIPDLDVLAFLKDSRIWILAKINLSYEDAPLWFDDDCGKYELDEIFYWQSLPDWRSLPKVKVE